LQVIGQSGFSLFPHFRLLDKGLPRRAIDEAALVVVRQIPSGTQEELVKRRPVHSDFVLCSSVKKGLSIFMFMFFSGAGMLIVS